MPYSAIYSYDMCYVKTVIVIHIIRYNDFCKKRLKFSHGQPKYVVQDKMQHSITECCIFLF